MKQQTLEVRVAAALGGKICIDDLEVLIPDIQSGISAADATARQERERSLDPTVAPGEAESAHHRASVHELQRDRLSAALPRVRQKLAEALAADAEDRWRSDADRVEARAAAAEERLAGYRDLAEQIVALIAEAEATNKEAARVNHEAPDDVHRRVYRVDLAQFEKLVLPDPDNPGRNLYPPHRPSVAEEYAASMGAPYHPGADWVAHQQQRAEQARAAAAQHAEYLANQTKMQEERQNREARENFERSQRRG
jgi:hypothetical protein